jgi:hypothetical protein
VNGRLVARRTLPALALVFLVIGAFVAAPPASADDSPPATTDTTPVSTVTELAPPTTNQATVPKPDDAPVPARHVKHAVTHSVTHATTRVQRPATPAPTRVTVTPRAQAPAAPPTRTVSRKPHPKPAPPKPAARLHRRVTTTPQPLPAVTPAPSVPAHSGVSTRRKWLLAAGIALLVAAALVAVFLDLRRRGAPHVDEGAAPDTAPPGSDVCTITLWRGYLRSQFIACTPGEPVTMIAESPFFGWRRSSQPPPRTAHIAAAHDDLLRALERLGWEADGSPEGQWFELRLRRAGVDTRSETQDMPAAALVAAADAR